MDIQEVKENKQAFIAPNATLVGDIVLGKDVSIWYGAVLRGDSGQICIGTGTNVQDNCVIHEKVTIGNHCTIGHGTIIHGCTIGNGCLVGMGAIILNGATLGDGCLVGAGALVTGKVCAPAGSLILGNPAKVVRALSEEEKETCLEDSRNYVALARKQLPLSNAF